MNNEQKKYKVFEEITKDESGKFPFVVFDNSILKDKIVIIPKIENWNDLNKAEFHKQCGVITGVKA